MLDKALEHIVPGRTLRLGPFSSMRDPRESHDWRIIGGGYVPEEQPDQHKQDDLHRWLEFTLAINELKSRVKVLSLTRDDPTERDAGSAVFGRGFAHPRLWEQYADNHRGVCLCFDSEKLIDRLAARLPGVDHGAVSYIDAEIASQALFAGADELRELGVTAALSNHVREHLDELFFTKLKDWETEMEYRFVVQTDHPEPIFVKVKSALRALILGADVSHFYEPAFAKVCDPFGIEIFYMRWIHGRPHLAPRYDQPAPPS